MLIITNMKPPDLKAITIDKIHSWPGQDNITIDVLRLDKIHTLISGNKWFKLHNYLEKAKQENKRLITFGGPWSNHIIATAAATALENIRSVGMIRGEKPQTLSPILQQAAELGMELVFLNRDDYAAELPPEGYATGSDLPVPQGGYGNPGMKGAMRIADHFDRAAYTHLCCSVGSGTMMAGLVEACSPRVKVTGFSSMKNNRTLGPEIVQLLDNKDLPFELLHDFHFGGFAKYDAQLLSFMNELYSETGIPTDIVYTAKLFYGVKTCLSKGYFAAGSRILIIHSGGLTGNLSLKNGTLIFPS